jgi:hypothetical protein
VLFYVMVIFSGIFGNFGLHLLTQAILPRVHKHRHSGLQLRRRRDRVPGLQHPRAAANPGAGEHHQAQGRDRANSNGGLCFQACTVAGDKDLAAHGKRTVQSSGGIGEKIKVEQINIFIV